ncbi:hypothetical protein DBR40_00940 [Pedobacter sp. KBW01]|uniref:hypothetical protein n=1 Tax=Pedobacter sp. KBW01 TaxID=2153364 RepID=UPI000F5AC2C4|nr:hypothetical protein [Pedobacter sp. KBW01]RQO80215.1 hypothetical protein DBR40_00940 [Pedobacter sp. KBW01]
MKVKLKAFFCLALVFQLLAGVVIAQQRVNIESLIPPSPNAGELGKYGQIPVGLNTGVPDISFPLYQIKSGSLSLPVTLSYHASGNQVNQRATDVGLGWSIQAGAQINRSVNGIADDANVGGALGYFNYTAPDLGVINSIVHQDSLKQYTQDYAIPYQNPTGTPGTLWGHDLEPDMFQYSLGGKSGKFIYTKAKSFMTIPQEPVRIVKFLDNSNKVCFRITDDDGVTYTFSNYTTSNFLSGYPSTCTDLTSYISTWHLTSIISADLQDTISLEYETAHIHDETEQHVKSIGRRLKDVWWGPDNLSYCLDGVDVLDTEVDPCSGFGKVKKTQVDYNELRIKRINFKNGYILFNRNSSRSDVPSIELSSNHALDNIEVYGSNQVLVKKYIFETDYYTAQPTSTDVWKNYRLRLKRFYEADVSAGPGKKEYAFEYETTPLPPYGSYNVDYWGFSNGQSNSDLIPYAVYDNTVFQSLYLGNLTGNSSVTVENKYAFTNPGSYVVGYANREPSADYMVSGILKKIVHPTGGYTQFEFEPHRYWSFYASQEKIGGGLRVKSIKNYSAAGVLATEDYYKYGTAESGRGTLLFDENTFYRSYEDVVDYYPSSALSGCNYGTSDGSMFAWRRNFLGISKYSSPGFNGSPVVYPTVARYNDGNGSNGKAVYKFNVELSANELIPGMFANSGNYGAINNAWHQGEQIEETHYRYANNQYYPVSRIKNQYSAYDLKDEVGVMFKPVINTIVSSPFVLTNYNGYQSLTSPGGPSAPNIVRSHGMFGVYQYWIKTGTFRKIKEIQTTFDAVDTTQKVDVVTDFVYANAANRYLSKREKTINSTEKAINRFKYPQDLSDAVSLSMVSRNMLSPVVEEKSYQSLSGTETLLSTVQTGYRQSGNLIVKDYIKASTGSLTPEPRVLFNQYDTSGNITEQQMADGVKESYLWGYHNAHPVAKIVNVPYNTAIQYVNQSILDNPSSDQQLRTELNNLRVNLPSAQVSTFTYQPLVGMTSQTDAKGMITYYEYDSFQRLKAVKNQNGEILKTYCYNYAGQQTDCNSSAGGTTPTTPTQVYARVEVENSATNPTSDGSSTDADIYIALYSDANCTQPVSLPQSLDVNMGTSSSSYENNVYAGLNWTDTYTVPANTNRLYLGRFTTDWWYSYYDPYYEQIINSYYYYYQIEDNGMNTYIPAGTY